MDLELQQSKNLQLAVMVPNNQAPSQAVHMLIVNPHVPRDRKCMLEH